MELRPVCVVLDHHCSIDVSLNVDYGQLDSFKFENSSTQKIRILSNKITVSHYCPFIDFSPSTWYIMTIHYRQSRLNILNYECPRWNTCLLFRYISLTRPDVYTRKYIVPCCLCHQEANHGLLRFFRSYCNCLSIPSAEVSTVIFTSSYVRPSGKSLRSFTAKGLQQDWLLQGLDSKSNTTPTCSLGFKFTMSFTVPATSRSRTANMSQRTWVVVKQIQSNPTSRSTYPVP